MTLAPRCDWWRDYRAQAPICRLRSIERGRRDDLHVKLPVTRFVLAAANVARQARVMNHAKEARTNSGAGFPRRCGGPFPPGDECGGRSATTDAGARPGALAFDRLPDGRAARATGPLRFARRILPRSELRANRTLPRQHPALKPSNGGPRRALERPARISTPRAARPATRTASTC